MSIAPIVDGERRHSKYDIPPHHPHTQGPHHGKTADSAAVEAATAPVELVRGDSGPNDFPKSATVAAAPEAALVPTDKGVALAGRLSALEDMGGLGNALGNGEGEETRVRDRASRDEIVDCH